MSAEKPEVSDVWGVRKPQVRILFVSDNAVRFLTILYHGIHPVIMVWPIGKFVERFNYIGHSKASIKDLFCVKENSENDTQTDLRKIDDMQGTLMSAAKSASRD